ncbi:GGDEF domain-containing protein [Vibrio campbellii]|uniref:GGDEF domain-containing protein n=1 Tax=Vibrio campbellii TaxID=680 RepID=UPI000CD34720|nr:GGDEF domain-containing protein [Vibrio campbellii]AUW06367.1 GGDEF domain-containing protein [Vibrio campbellii]
MNLKNLYLSLFVSLVLFMISITLIGAVVISYEVKQFSLYTESVNKMKQKVIMLGLLTEESLKANAHQSAQEVISSTSYNFPDSIYPLSDSQELDFVEAIARKSMYESERFVSSIYDRKGIILYFRSYTQNKLIFDHPVEGLDSRKAELNAQWCKENHSCVLSAWNGQLTDRILISNPFKTPVTNAIAVSIMSPVYFEGKLVGEFGEQVHLDSLYREGKAIDITTNNGYKHVLLYFPDYPWPHVAYSQTYMADNNNLIVYDYPLSKVVIDYSFLYLIYFTVAFAYFSKVQETKQNRLDLANALSNATKDELTGLFNRKVFREELFKRKLRAAPYSVIAIDGDRVKRINDKYGHHVGDEVIVIIADAMRKVFRTTDYLIRTGGDEFVAILPGCSASKASTLEKKLQDTVRENPLKKMEVNISVSTGLAISNENESLQDVIMRADEELYETKRQRV